MHIDFASLIPLGEDTLQASSLESAESGLGSTGGQGHPAVCVVEQPEADGVCRQVLMRFRKGCVTDALKLKGSAGTP